jgi:dethiobiotin synthetase
MSKAYIVTGTDTGIGKTTVAAMLVLALDASYWKPIQSGTEEGTDRQRVQALTQLPDNRFLPERYVLSQPLSPHRAAELDGIEIKAEALALPGFDRTLELAYYSLRAYRAWNDQPYAPFDRSAA